jgi:AcrR family transcriptional regulator
MAVAMASREGLAGVSLGRLASELGLSKSGVYAHFKSKHRLQMEIIEVAREVFFREVVAPGLANPDGLPRLRGLCEAFLDYVRREVFPGGCFFAGMMSEFDAQVGPIHDEVTADQSNWLGLLRQAASAAKARGELDHATDPDQLVFELDAALELANYMYVLFGDPVVLERAGRSITSSIEHHLP